MLKLADTLGVKISSEPWDGAVSLPYFLNELYTLKKVMLDSTACIFAEPMGEVPAVQAIAKHFSRIHDAAEVPVVLQMNGLSGERRKAFIKSRIPFVAAGQIYLPFMGIVLQEQLYAEPKSREKLMPSAQLLLFSYLYQSGDKMYTSPMAGKLGLSAMQITRAVRQLHKLNLIEVSKEGVQIVISGKTNRRALFESAVPYLLDPVKEINYLAHDSLPDHLPYAGLHALAELSMLSAPMVATRAYYSKTNRILGENALTDSDRQTRLEIWKYAPTLLSNRDDIADPLSVIVSLRDERDERVEQAIEEVLENLWR
jgi:DNA-binding MarR family transcriptional regulator